MDKSVRWSVKMKVEQPRIMCAGRTPISCYYRGIAERIGNDIYVTFKRYGRLTTVVFNKDKCITDGWQDLKLL